MNKVEINKVALKFKCWVDSVNRLFYLGEDKPKYLGKVYWKEKTGYFHGISTTEYRYEGQKQIDILLENILKREGYIK